MKKVLYGDKGNFYKANLHCHSTYSDGLYTVDRIKEEYMKRGYSIIAFTDHEYMVDQQRLTDDNFLAINSYEVAFDSRRPGPGHEDYKFVVTYHLNLYKKTPDDLTHIFWNPDNCWCGDREIIKNAKYVGEPNTKKGYGTERINEFIRTAHENNFLVSYNHARWSMHRYPDYIGLEDLDFLEIYNQGCMTVGTDDYLPHMYDDFLRTGKRLWCTCADDNHGTEHFDDPDNDSFGGWVVVNAPDLKYETIINALEKGDFYASTGAVIKEITNDNGRVTVKTDPAKSITFTTGTRNAYRAVPPKGEKFITEAAFTVYPDDDYVRIEVTDCDGFKANSQAYFPEDLF